MNHEGALRSTANRRRSLPSRGRLLPGDQSRQRVVIHPSKRLQHASHHVGVGLCMIGDAHHGFRRTIRSCYSGGWTRHGSPSQSPGTPSRHSTRGTGFSCFTLQRGPDLLCPFSAPIGPSVGRFLRKPHWFNTPSSPQKNGLGPPFGSAPRPEPPRDHWW